MSAFLYPTYKLEDSESIIDVLTPNVPSQNEVLETISQLYTTQNRHIRESARDQVPSAYVDIFNDEGIPLTKTHLETFVHNVTALSERRASSICKDSLILSQKPPSCRNLLKKPPAFQHCELTVSLLSKAHNRLSLKLPRSSLLTNSIVEGPEFPQLMQFSSRKYLLGSQDMQKCSISTLKVDKGKLNTSILVYYSFSFCSDSISFAATSESPKTVACSQEELQQIFSKNICFTSVVWMFILD